MEKHKAFTLQTKIPEALSCFAGVYLPQFNSVYIQGGYGDSENKNFYSLNLETLEFQPQTANSEILVGHSAVEIEGRMFIFGG